MNSVKNSYKRIRLHPDEDSCEGQHSLKKTKIENVPSHPSLDFNDPPKHIFNQLKIPRKVDDQHLCDPLSVSDSVSSIPPPVPFLENGSKNVDNPTTKSGKFSKPKEYYRCKQCNLFLSSQSTLDAHFAGARHAKKLKELEIKDNMDNLKREKIKKFAENEFKCSLCDVLATSFVQIKSHIDGSKHKKKLQNYREKEKKDKLSSTSIKQDDSSKTIAHTERGYFSNSDDKSDAQISNDNITTSINSLGGSFFCTICGLHMNSSQQYDQHVNSKKHSAKIATLQTPT